MISEGNIDNNKVKVAVESEVRQLLGMKTFVPVQYDKIYYHTIQGENEHHSI
jgi:hypothetical protein